jgi:hypothetical protein
MSSKQWLPQKKPKNETMIQIKLLWNRLIKMDLARCWVLFWHMDMVSLIHHHPDPVEVSLSISNITPNLY